MILMFSLRIQILKKLHIDAENVPLVGGTSHEISKGMHSLH